MSEEENILKILVTTDNHLGYGEKDPVRGEDSFTAFEECLQHALDNDVDFILLGGDLFHDSNPSSNSLHKCMKLLRRYTLGDKPIEFEIVNGQDASFLESLQRSANFEDPNMNVSIPVFSIHGNHDDPSGFGRLSSLDILSITGLVNYFGKWTNLERVNINPIMIRKGDTKLALFGLSHIYDTRLVRLFADYKVTMEKPDDSWFNLMVLHQNRADRGPKNYLCEEILPSFLDLIIWGHEHDCRIVPEQNELKNFFVSQPGSTTPTSLSEGESLDKHCGLLLIRDNQFRLEPIKLKTVRPFIFDSLNLADCGDRLNLKRNDVQEQVKRIVTEKVEEMIELAKTKLTGHPKQPTEPIIRLRVQFENEEQIFNTIRFGQGYIGRVANHNDMILRHKTVKKKDEVKPLDMGALEEILEEEKENKHVRVEDIVSQYFDTVAPDQKLKVLSPMCMGEIMRRLVDAEDYHSADSITDFHVDKALEFLIEKMPDEEDTPECLDGFQALARKTLRAAIENLERTGVNEQAETLRQKFFEGSSVANGTSRAVKDDEEDEDDVMLVSVLSNSTAASSSLSVKPKAARGAAKTRGSTRGKAATTTTGRRKAEPLNISVSGEQLNEKNTNRVVSTR